MPKLGIIIGAVVAGVVVVGGVITAVVVNNNSKPSDSSQTASTESSKKVAAVDPDGVYKLFSDPSVTKKPEDNVKFGNGQTLTFEYDGSKTDNDQYATLSYQLYYIQDNGAVIPMGGGNVEGKGSGTFTLSDKVFDSAAKGRSGFLELEGTYNTSFDENYKITGSNAKLGMYSVVFDIAE